jgi:hypothetical protein
VIPRPAWLGQVRRPLRKLLRSDGAGPDDGQVIHLDYPVLPKPRFGYDRPAHPQLYEIIAGGRAEYARLLESFLVYVDELLAIGLDATAPREPSWHNGWFQGLDALALYSLVASTNPRRLVEVGSGHSTMFARRAIEHHRLHTTITSIDPRPRADIDKLCDRIVRSSLESADLTLFDEIEAGDIFFFDGSHRCFTNSDVTVAFLEVLPRLPAGALIHIHDIFLPWDYPDAMSDRYYSEQYLLAAYLLAEQSGYEIVLPNFFVCIEPDLHRLLAPVWDHFTWSATPTNGLSFWLRKR